LEDRRRKFSRNQERPGQKNVSKKNAWVITPTYFGWWMLQDMDDEQRIDVTGAGPKVLKVEEAARQLGIGRTLAYGLVRSGTLRSLKIGSRRLVPRTAIAEFLDRQSQEEDAE
jgi:excisionase family DNA binding protein